MKLEMLPTYIQNPIEVDQNNNSYQFGNQTAQQLSSYSTNNSNLSSYGSSSLDYFTFENSNNRCSNSNNNTIDSTQTTTVPFLKRNMKNYGYDQHENAIINSFNNSSNSQEVIYLSDFFKPFNCIIQHAHV
jgi:hypothetical protein